VTRVTATGLPQVFLRGYQAQVLIASDQYSVLYTFDGAWIRRAIAGLFLGGFALALAGYWLSRIGVTSRFAFRARRAFRQFWRLRAKFLLTIVLVNAITAGIVFFTLSSLQTREETRKIEKESLLFSQFSTAQVVSDFTNFFYFYYLDRFLPEIKRIIASNENLLKIRIVSSRTGAVLFDSDQVAFVPVAQQASEASKARFSTDVSDQLKNRDYAVERAGQGSVHDASLLIVNTYRNENQDALFLVEYVFSYATLARSVATIRKQILLDLIPSTLLGLLIALAFTQLLLKPLRRLAGALQKVTEGNYDVTVEAAQKDEIGELVTAFNAMTMELRKKKELRKYLSDSTYRQIMQAPDSPEGLKLGGSRVQATVLFSDIRNFVAHCESLEAEEVTNMLNEYFSEMVEVVYKHGGEVDKFIGDALLAVFYSSEDTATIRQEPGSSKAADAPSSVETSLQSIYCALEMRERLAEFNKRRLANNKNTIEIGIGITHGEIISGPIGSKDRMDFTVIGDVVNLASRIEKLSKQGKHTRIVFADEVETRVRSLLDYEELVGATYPGKEEGLKIFELIGVRDLSILVSNLSAGDVSLKRRSLEILGQSRNLEALPHVIRMLSDREEQTRLQAALALGKLCPKDHKDAVDALFDLLARETSQKVIASAIAMIGRVCTTDRMLELAPFLDFPDERIVANTVEAIGQIRSPRASDLLIPKLSSRNNRVKANAAMALFAAGHVEVVNTLKPMLMHSDPLMRSSAAFAIGELTLIAAHDTLGTRWGTDPRTVKVVLGEVQEAVSMLVALLKDADQMVRRQAVIALGKIRDRSAVLPMIDMIQPELDSKDLVRDITQALRAIGSHRLVREVISKLSN
jgi:class 3 adenylate cyclase